MKSHGETTFGQGNLAEGSWGGDEHHQLVSLWGGEGIGIHGVMVI